MSVCAKCQQPLLHELDSDSDSDASDNEGAGPSTSGPQTVPDDVHLPCNDHFHWECLLDTYELDKCPVCATTITSPPENPNSSNPQILVNLHNEGGHEHGLDIFPILQEESYLRAYPEDRKARAFLEFCREGDHRAIVDLLQSCNNPSPAASPGPEGDAMDTTDDDNLRTHPLAGPSKSPSEILRYQDPIGGLQSGLHAAAANGHREVAYLLLLLASSYPEQEFPPLVFQEAAALGMMREDQTGKVDIRSLRDEAGRTAEDVAREEGGVVWNGWVGSGRLAV